MSLAPPAAPKSEEWQAVAPGLEVGRFVSPQRATVGDSTVTAVRVDPARYEFRLPSANLFAER